MRTAGARARRRAGRGRAAAAGIALAVLAAGGCSDDTPAGSEAADALAAVRVPDTIVVTSPVLTDGGPLALPFTCEGPGFSPPLQWTDLPEGTAEVTVVLDDIDAPGGTYVHWIATGIDPTEAALLEGQLPPDAVSAVNSGGEPGYAPPCPPEGEEHRYVFSVYALGEPLPAPEALTVDETLDAIAGSAIARGVLATRFTR
ncbi:MAG: YbhB/YbcL family Raf kinase inhibitor-like protein [Acidimicrobiales bacterium]|nr:YbhB/YbcL family Raf kinase inhibitor-like protein [Acidimicrobiales bacterium]